MLENDWEHPQTAPIPGLAGEVGVWSRQRQIHGWISELLGFVTPIPWWPQPPTPQDNHSLAFLILMGQGKEFGM